MAKADGNAGRHGPSSARGWSAALRPAMATVAAGLLAACVSIGPTVPVQPGPGLTAATLGADRTACMARTDAEVQPVANRMASAPAEIQRLYDAAYGRCMAARGNIVTVAAPGPAAAGGSARLPFVGQDDAGSSAAYGVVRPMVERFRAACPGERIEVRVLEFLGGPAQSRLVDLSTPDGGGCFGQPGMNEYVVADTGRGWRVLLAAEPGSIVPLAPRPDGYPDVELRSLGQCVVGHRWNGSGYVRTGATGCISGATPTVRTLRDAIGRR